MGKKSGSVSGCVLSHGLRDVVALLASKSVIHWLFIKILVFPVKLAQEEVFLNWLNHRDHIITRSSIRVIAPGCGTFPFKVFSIFLFLEKLIYIQINGTIIIITL